MLVRAEHSRQQQPEALKRLEARARTVCDNSEAPADAWSAGAYPLLEEMIVKTPKALTNCSPGLAQPWVAKREGSGNAEGVGNCSATLANAFSVGNKYTFGSWGCRKLQPQARISERLRRSTVG
jgi:hypothetical protein